MHSNNWWFATQGVIPVPAGLIVPYNDVAANIPAGWSQFDNAGGFTSNRLIRGHGSTAGSSGGSNVTGNIGTNSVGAHTGSLNEPHFTTAVAGANMNFWSSYSSQGGWAHTVTLSYRPPRRELLLIKASSEQKKLPANACLLSVDALTKITDITPTGETFAFQAGSTPASQSASLAGNSCTSVGLHHHIGGTQGASTAAGTPGILTYYWNTSNPGNHSHGFNTPSLSADNIKRVWVSLWSEASQEFALEENAIAMWESATPPEGWAICDGTNGTPNMVDYFIGFDSAKRGTSDGNDTITVSGTMVNNGTHNHTGASVNPSTGANRPHQSQNSHGHSYSGSPTLTPEYYTLIFIKLIG